MTVVFGRERTRVCAIYSIYISCTGFPVVPMGDTLKWIDFRCLKSNAHHC